MSEARKIFPMDTFVAYLKGDGSANVAEMLGYLTQKDLDADSVPFAAALAKAWIYEQHPELTKMSKGQVVELGQSVSVAPMPVKAKTEVDEVFAKLADYKGQINAKQIPIVVVRTRLLGISVEATAGQQGQAGQQQHGSYVGQNLDRMPQGHGRMADRREDVHDLSAPMGHGHDRRDDGAGDKPVEQDHVALDSFLVGGAVHAILEAAVLQEVILDRVDDGVLQRRLLVTQDKSLGHVGLEPVDHVLDAHGEAQTNTQEKQHKHRVDGEIAGEQVAAGTDFGFSGGSQDPFADSNW